MAVKKLAKKIGKAVTKAATEQLIGGGVSRSLAKKVANSARQGATTSGGGKLMRKATPRNKTATTSNKKYTLDEKRSRGGRIR